jgi:hypothetical protein
MKRETGVMPALSSTSVVTCVEPSVNGPSAPSVVQGEPLRDGMRRIRSPPAILLTSQPKRLAEAKDWPDVRIAFGKTLR